MLTYHDGPSVIIDEEGHEWPIYTAKIDTNAIAHEFPELNITPDEAATVIEQVLDRFSDEMTEYMADWIREVR